MKGNEKQREGFEEAMARLEKIVADLEKGDQPLEAALESFEEAFAIGKRCRDILEDAELRVKRLVEVADDGGVESEDIEDDD